MLADRKLQYAGSLKLFTEIFYKLRTGRNFEISNPIARESHYITICRELTKVIDGETKRLIINVPPRYGKTELLIHFCAWAMAQHPDSNFLYVSYSHSLAKKQTQTIRSIIQLAEFRELFGVRLDDETSAKDNFETDRHGSVYAAGTGGTITGRGAGIHGVSRFGGAVVLDDAHKPDEASSDTIREGIIEWYFNTLQSRINNPNTPIIYIGQRVHEDDLAARLIKSGEWKQCVIKSLDDAGNALHPGLHTKDMLIKMREENPYVFASQYQQDPQPAGGGIFKPEWFYLMDDDPDIISTFITADTAETDKDYNDASVFSFWGLYRIRNAGYETNEYGLHCIDCRELHVEPKDLESEFMSFYTECSRYKVKPMLAAIEKKSTGVTLVSVLQKLRGLQVKEIERTRASGSKTARFLEMQPYVASKRISLRRYAKHVEPFLEHMRKITANDTHAHDDIADTLYDAVKLALIDKYAPLYGKDTKSDDILDHLAQNLSRQNKLRDRAYGAGSS